MKKVFMALGFSILASTVAMVTHAKKLAIVLDDSAGMCGYLDAPIEENAYKKTLQVLLKARDVSKLDIQAYYLSNLDKAMPVGATLDQLIAANSASCPLRASTSPIHMGLDNKKLKADAVILLTDLLFDEGGMGGSDSRNALIQHFDRLAIEQQKTAKSWFNSSAGIVGIKSDFKGIYYSIHMQGKTDFSKQSVERPFYLLWTSKTSQFFPYLNQLTYVWTTPNRGKNRLAIEAVAAIRLLPITELVSAKQGLFLKPFRNSLLEKKLADPNVYYGKNQNSAIQDQILSVKNTVKNPIPLECFKTTSNPFLIQFQSSCANGGVNQSALFKHKNFPSSIILSYPLKDQTRGVKRTFMVQTQEQGFNNPVKAYYRDQPSSEVFREQKGKYPANLVLHIESLKSPKSILFNSPSIKNKELVFNVIEQYQANTSTSISILPALKKYWSDIREPCLEKKVECLKANTTTYQFDGLVSSLITRLNANQQASTLLNQASQPIQIKIVAQ